MSATWGSVERMVSRMDWSIEVDVVVMGDGRVGVFGWLDADPACELVDCILGGDEGEHDESRNEEA